MLGVMEALRLDHRVLVPEIEKLRSTADSMFLASVEAANDELEEAYFFLTHELLPHASAEEQVLYPLVEQILGQSYVTAMMVMDHKELRRLSEELGGARLVLTTEPLEHQDRKRFRRLLYSLYAIARLHFAKEEDVLLPLLESHLSEVEATSLIQALEAATERSRSQAI